MDALHYLRYRLRHTLPKGNARRLLVIAVLVLALPVALITVKEVQRYRTGAALASVNLYFEPGQQNLPPNSNFKLMANAGTNQVAFIRVDFTFDPTKVQLASEITPTSALATVVQKTTMATANSTGVATLVIAKSPVDTNNPPSGTFEIANVNVTSVTQAQNTSAALSYVDSTVQLVDMQSQLLPFTTQPASLTLNYVAPNSPTSTSAPTQIATATSVPTATSTLTPTTRPTNTPTVTLTSTLAPTATNTVTPSATSTPRPTATNTNAPTATTALKLGDVNGDGVIGITDIGIIVDFYGTNPPGDIRADVNKDGAINIVDIGIVIDHYGL